MPPAGPESPAAAQGSGAGSDGGASSRSPGATSPGARGAARLAAGALKAAAASRAAAAEDAAKAAPAARPHAAAAAAPSAGAASASFAATPIVGAAAPAAPERLARPRAAAPRPAAAPSGAGSSSGRGAVDVRALLGDDNDATEGFEYEPAPRAVAYSHGDSYPVAAGELLVAGAGGSHPPASPQDPAAAGLPQDPAAAGLPGADVCVVADPYSDTLTAMLQHCGCGSSLGLAVQAHDGKPALVSVYAPPALMQLEDVGGQLVQWPAAVYLIDPLAAAAAYGGGADGDIAAAALLCSLQPLLEAPSVAKVVHGGGAALACLEAAIAASSGGGTGATCSQGVQDSRIVLASVEAMLGLQHTPQLQAPQVAGPDSGVGGLRGLHTHVARLRDALASTGLWADRPQLLAALTARHFAALQEDAQAALGATGVDDDAAARLLTRPLGPSQMEVAARCARHLPELWTALVQEAVPWVAAHASAAALALNRHSIAAA
ncbi:hypothetical protein HXX76_013204 [Chlamydomonas incerta]|uniref:Uncharacterized protein n=1 Tax=Chlamydomonas incerta TaxID=51695 RepID=A0A835ST18_CHLIN|nr:hypothetical protein HXX76_013204 [Chlamydomonas incerta]|eukprot:KAG2426225.1 hypothetical protein HXX76_013204 [Chlamydomonas incerta]